MKHDCYECGRPCDCWADDADCRMCHDCFYTGTHPPREVANDRLDKIATAFQKVMKRNKLNLVITDETDI